MKSPAQDAALDPLRKRQSVEFTIHKELLEQYEREQLTYEVELARWKKSKNHTEPPKKPEALPQVRFTISDCTMESIAPILEANPRGLLLTRDELSGWIGSFNQYRAGKGGDVPNWLEMQRAGTITVDRKTGRRVIHIPRAAVSVCGTIQPQTLRRQLTPEFFDCGLAPRLLLAMPPVRKKQWMSTDISERIQERYADMLNRLLSLEHAISQDGDHFPKDIVLTVDAKSLWIDWVNECGQLGADAENDRTAAAIAKAEGYAARLALVHQLVRNTESTAIDAEAVSAGINLARWCAREAERTYSLWSEDPEEREYRELVEWVGSHGGSATVRELKQGWRRYRNNPGAADRDLEQLVRAGCGSWEYVGGGKPGAPSKRFRLFNSPSVYGVNGIETSIGATENVGSDTVDTVDARQNATDDNPPIDSEHAEALATEPDAGQEWGEL